MATIVERISDDGSKSFQVKVRLKGYPIQTATFERKTDAAKWAQHTESAIREGRHFKTREAKRHTLGEMVDRYIRDVLPRKPKSLKNQKIQLLWWKQAIGSYSIADVTPSLIAEHRDQLAKGETNRKQPRSNTFNDTALTPKESDNSAKNEPEKKKTRSNSTVRRYLAILSHAFTIAVNEWQWAEDNPLRKVSKPQEGRGRVRFLGDEERIKLLEACQKSLNHYLYPIVVLCLSTGARKMEIIGLRWSQVDFQRHVLMIEETKNKERKVLPLVGLAHELLSQHSKVRRLNTDFVFPGKNPQKPIEIEKAWDTALTKAEIMDFRFHDLRHTAASYLAMNGATLAEIAEVLGHKTLQMVKRYAHLSEAHTAKIVTSMNQKIFG